MPRKTSQLTAIMFINIVEYTRLMRQYLAKALFQALIRIEIWISIKDNGPGIPAVYVTRQIHNSVSQIWDKLNSSIK